MKYSYWLGASVLALGAMNSQEVGAQEAQAEAPALGEAAQNGEILVTAQRREERLRDVPIAITVVDGDALRSTGATQIQDIVQRAPSLNFQPLSSSPNFSVRGLGTATFDPTIEQTVGIAVDDVNISIPRYVPVNSLADVERVEVLRGPQGLLFGKNTNGGLISVTTARPRLGVTSTRGSIQYGSRNQIQANAIVNIPLGDTLAARFRASYRKQDPLARARGAGQLNPLRNWNVNGKLLWEPSDKLSVYLIGDYEERSGGSDAYTIRKLGVGYAPLPGGGVAPFAPQYFLRDELLRLGIVPGPENRAVSVPKTPLFSQTSLGVQGKVEYDLGSAAITSVTAYRNIRYGEEADFDGTALPVLDINRASMRGHQFSQELRLSSKGSGPLSYIAGLYYFDQNTTLTTDIRGKFGIVWPTSPILLSALAGGGIAEQVSNRKNYAAFGQLDFRFADRFKAFAGARYTYDDVRTTSAVIAIPGVCALTSYSPFPLFVGSCLPTPPLPSAAADRKKGGWTFRTGLSYEFADTANVYASYSRGYKGPGVSLNVGQRFLIDSETVDAYEVGMKAALFNYKLNVNIAGFINKFKGFQTNVFDTSLPPAGAFRAGNADDVTLKGIELELISSPVRGLTFAGGVTYLANKFTDFSVPCLPLQTQAQGCIGGQYDVSGFPLSNSPKWTVTLSSGYQTEIAKDVDVFVNADMKYRDQAFFLAGNPETIQPSYAVVNGSAGFSLKNNTARISFFVRNLFNKHYAALIAPTFAFDTGGYSQLLTDESWRRLGVSLEWRF